MTTVSDTSLVEFSPEDIAAYWAKVSKRSDTECWPWLGSTNQRDGRGIFRIRNLNMSAPRAAWLIHTGQWPGKLFACHTCDNPNCVNPNHLFLGGARENARDAASKGRLSMQRRPENSYFGKSESLKHRPRGEAHGGSKLAESDIPLIRERLAAGESQTSIGRAFGVSGNVICRINLGKLWSHIKPT